jgi:hypothetical protein
MTIVRMLIAILVGYLLVYISVSYQEKHRCFVHEKLGIVRTNYPRGTLSKTRLLKNLGPISVFGLVMLPCIALDSIYHKGRYYYAVTRPGEDLLKNCTLSEAECQGENTGPL